MSLLHADVPWGLAAFGGILAMAAIALSVREVRHGFLPADSSQHGWLAAVVTVALLWALQARSPTGLDFGLLGSALFALVFGRARAVLGLMAALLLFTALDAGSWINIGINGLLLAVIPAWLASALQGQIERRLPRNVFVFIIGNGMFVTLLVAACTRVLVLSVAGAGATAPMPGDHLAYSLLLAWGEALLSGMLFSALVVFTPRAVLTYRQDLYLPPLRRIR